MGDLIFGSRGNLGKFLGKAHRNGKKSPNLELSLRELKILKNELSGKNFPESWS